MPDASNCTAIGAGHLAGRDAARSEQELILGARGCLVCRALLERELFRAQLHGDLLLIMPLPRTGRSINGFCSEPQTRWRGMVRNARTRSLISAPVRLTRLFYTSLPPMASTRLSTARVERPCPWPSGWRPRAPSRPLRAARRHWGNSCPCAASGSSIRPEAPLAPRTRRPLDCAVRAGVRGPSRAPVAASCATHGT